MLEHRTTRSRVRLPGNFRRSLHTSSRDPLFVTGVHTTAGTQGLVLFFYQKFSKIIISNDLSTLHMSFPFISLSLFLPFLLPLSLSLSVPPSPSSSDSLSPSRFLSPSLSFSLPLPLPLYFPLLLLYP